MSTYPQRVADNILPLSIAGTLPEAFQEWSFSGRTEDHEVATEDCELCDHEQLRYHFEIVNRHTKKRLWVGSQCILKFKVPVYEDERLLDEVETRKKLDSLVKKMRLDSCMNALRRLVEEENNTILRNALEYFQKNKYLSPKYAAVIFWRLNSNNIDHSPSFFKVSLKRKQHKKDLREMETWRAQHIWPALTSSQRKIAIKYGHSAPE